MTSFALIELLVILTVLAAFAYLAFFAASKATGALKLLGRILGAWILLLMAAALAVFAILPALSPAPPQQCDRWTNES